jgi:hypothetical protein
MTSDTSAGRRDDDAEMFDDPEAVTIDDGPGAAEAGAPAGEGKAARKGSRRDWIIRGVVFGTLAVFLVLALLDYRAKNSAVKTYETWQATLKERNDKGTELFSDDLLGLATGSPTVEEKGQLSDGMRHGQSLRRYVWSGVFRKYPIEVYIDRGLKPSVAEIVPPSDVMAADQARAESE